MRTCALGGIALRGNPPRLRSGLGPGQTGCSASPDWSPSGGLLSVGSIKRSETAPVAATAAPPSMRRKVAQNMIDCFNLIETHYLPQADQGPWVMGEQYTVADGYLFTIGTWLQSDGVDIAQFPKVHAHTQRVLQRPAVQRALA